MAVLTTNLHGSGEFVGDCGLTVQHIDGADEVTDAVIYAAAL